MTAGQYKSYLSSDLWRTNRAYLREFPYYRACAVCGDDKEVHLHHSYYSWLGPLYFPPRFIYPLCKAHHQALHSTVKRGRPLQQATEDLVSSVGEPILPREYLAHKALLSRVQAELDQAGALHGFVSKSPVHIVGIDDEPFVMRVTTLPNRFDYLFLSEVKQPARKAIVYTENDQLLTLDVSKELSI